MVLVWAKHLFFSLQIVNPSGLHESISRIPELISFLGPLFGWIFYIDYLTFIGAKKIAFYWQILSYQFTLYSSLCGVRVRWGGSSAIVSVSVIVLSLRSLVPVTVQVLLLSLRGPRETWNMGPFEWVWNFVSAHKKKATVFCSPWDLQASKWNAPWWKIFKKFVSSCLIG